MQYLKDIFYLFFPYICVNCKLTLLQNEKHLCTYCVNDLPIIDDNPHTNVTLLSTFNNKVPVKNVRSFLYYQKHGITQKIIHELKYKNQPSIGNLMGAWFGHRLKESNIFSDVDFIVPVPLHKEKLKKRGYNQLTTFGTSLGNILQIEYKPEVLIRTSISNTQTLKERFDRFSNQKTTFRLSDTSIFKNKHILLIDDVITTGATLLACCKELLQTPNITISIATISFTEKT
ncbi:phosphoribosyltransferase family protein [uncultured Tenacibaculum sp.]|uniref:ComF family protein n=1 Tax=uncultured Tenacibaculum sp. TaxID=174713 RepID=UPI00262B7E89|nr:phosphoribosyltransferase family protein [uncultured Tenacibaculum sp.]